MSVNGQINQRGRPWQLNLQIVIKPRKLYYDAASDTLKENDEQQKYHLATANNKLRKQEKPS